MATKCPITSVSMPGSCGIMFLRLVTSRSVDSSMQAVSHLCRQSVYSVAMPPRVGLFAFTRAIAHRPKVAVGRWQNERIAAPLFRGFADSRDLPETQDNKGPNTDTLPHITEEAAAMSKIRGGEGPDIEQGTPVEEVRHHDHKALCPNVWRLQRKKLIYSV